MKSSTENVWACNYCNQEFANEAEALEHEQNCEYRDNDWVCDKCGKEFDTESEAKKHEKNCKGAGFTDEALLDYLYQKLLERFHPDLVESPVIQKIYKNIKDDIEKAYKAKDISTLKEIDSI